MLEILLIAFLKCYIKLQAALHIFSMYANIYFSSCGLQLDARVREAFDVAYDNIYAFHLAQRSPERIIENMKVRVLIFAFQF